MKGKLRKKTSTTHLIAFIGLLCFCFVSGSQILHQHEHDTTQQDDDDTVRIAELCPQLMHHVFEQAAPIGDNDAGNFSEHSKDMDITTCVENCCYLKSNCNVAFVFNSICYHVKCKSNALCLPKERQHVTRKLQMVLVNPVAEGNTESHDTSWLDTLKTANMENFLSTAGTDKTFSNHWKKQQDNKQPFPFPERPQYDDEPEKHINQILLRKFDFDNFGTEQQYALVDDNDIPMDEPTSYIASQLCESGGLGSQCRMNEECMQLVPKSREGICNCVDGYIRDKAGICIKSDLDFSADTLIEKVFAKTFSDERQHENIGVEETPSGPRKHLAVSVISKNVRLPDKEASLIAYTVPDEVSSGETYKYLWTLVSQPNGASNGSISDATKNKIKLSNLSEGLYVYKVTVLGNSSYGETVANVTVLPVKRINKHPEVIITPQNQSVKWPNSQAILDGSTSKDDDKIISWHWELVQGPIGYEPKLPEASTLQLTDLNSPGNYTFKLTVTDSDNAQNSTTANINVLKGTDYPPSANAGNDVIIYLPHNNVTLNGSMSTDDHEIVGWEWTKDTTDQSTAVDMQNTRTPFLQLSNLEEGIYTFVLKVTDASNQSNTATVHVFVKPPANLPPTANAGRNMTINLPQTWALLNGSQSSDDIRITVYSWRQISGPNNAVIANANASIANATSLTIGKYQFGLDVEDENQNKGSDRVWIKVIQEKNAPPTANAGGDQSVILPVNVITLNGSRSSDDLGIVNFTWTRDGSSLATGTIVGKTDHESVMLLTNVVPGRYVFRLTVADDQGLTNTDTVSVIVHPDPLVFNLVELTLSMGMTILTQSQIDSLQQKIVLLIGDVHVRIRDLRMEPKSGDAIVIFYVEKIAPDGKSQVIPGLEVEKILKEKFWRDASILGTTFTDVRTTVCQNKCSDHGFCNAVTRACICETFWMPSFFYFMGIEEGNCDWSILYVVVGIFSTFLFLSAIFWGITCLCRRTKKPRSRPKAQKYSLLGTHDDEIPAFTRNNSTITDSETDSDVVFENRSKQNGILRTSTANGSINKNGTAFSTTRLGRRIKT